MNDLLLKLSRDYTRALKKYLPSAPEAILEHAHDLGRRAVARGLGCEGVRVERPEDLEEAFDAAFKAPGPAVVDVRVDPNATPIHSYRRRLEQGGTHPRPGTVYQLPAWRRSPPSIDPPEGSTYSSA